MADSPARSAGSGAGTVLVVDDDPDVLQAARLLLKRHFARVVTSETPDAIDAFMDESPIDVFLLDMNFAIGVNSGAEGLHWLGHIRSRDPDAVVVLMTAFADVNTAVNAMREGAADFVMKPWQNDKLLATLSVASSLRRTRSQVTELRGPGESVPLLGRSAPMRSVRDMIERAAPTDVNVLIRGENGTGKDLVARAVHAASARADRPLLTVDLGAVSESLFESELFGHVKGAFTDAVRDRPGRFQAADGGTLFLDEVGNLPATLQTRLLRALEAREVTPVGSDAAVPVDVRLIAATNQPLEQMVEAGTFRRDLLYRLNTIEIVVPPLRERGDDIPWLAEHFVQQHSRRYRLPPRRLTEAAVAALRSHHWPGNVRELSHAVERALILSEGDAIDAPDLALAPAAAPDAPSGSLDLEANEKRLIELALERAVGNISHAAQALGITRARSNRRIEKHGIRV